MMSIEIPHPPMILACCDKMYHFSKELRITNRAGEKRITLPSPVHSNTYGWKFCPFCGAQLVCVDAEAFEQMVDEHGLEVYQYIWRSPTSQVVAERHCTGLAEATATVEAFIHDGAPMRFSDDGVEEPPMRIVVTLCYPFFERIVYMYDNNL